MARFLRSRSHRLLQLGELVSAGAHRDEVGARALGLAQALERGLPVADTWVLPAEAFRDIFPAELPSGHDPLSLLKIIDRSKGVERAARARERLLEVELSPVVSADLAGLWEDLSEQDEGATPVLTAWSSPTCESDAVVRAVLDRRIDHIRSLDELHQAIRELWSQLAQEGVLKFLRSRRAREAAQAVVIQRLPSDLTLTGWLTTRAIDRTREWSYVPVREAGALPTEVRDGIERRSAVRFTMEGNVLQRAVRSPEAALSQPQVSALAELGDKVGLDAALEVAWGASGPLVLGLFSAASLQQLEGGDTNTVWSLASLGEVLPGVPTPLTWSLAEPFVTKAYSEAFQATGAKPPKGQRVVTNLDGRFYYNLSAFIEAAAQVPGLDLTMLLELVEGAEREQVLAGLELESPSWLRLPFSLSRILGEQRRLTQQMERFESEVDAHRRWLADMDLAILPDDSLKTTLRESYDFLERTAQLLLDCATAMITTYVGLKTVLARSRPVQAEHLAQTLVAGVGDLTSVETAVAVVDVARALQSDPTAHDALVAGERDLKRLPAGPAVDALQRYLAAYGDRGPREVELSSPRWRENPASLLELLLCVAGGEPDADAAQSRARANADRVMAELEERAPRLELLLIRTLVARCRRFVRLRERARVWLARTISMLRQVTLDVDRRLRRLSPELPYGGAFYCTYDELQIAVRSLRADLGPLVQMRRAEHAERLARPDPPASFPGAPTSVPHALTDRTVLPGVAGSAGQVSGKARIVGPGLAGIDAVQPGDIIVTRAADLSLGPALLIAGGVVTEIGGPLSHLLLVARELGVPAAVNVRDAVALVREGEMLRVDGDRGSVERLEA